MADSKISDLTSVASVDGTDEFAVNDSLVSKKASAAQILTYVNANISLGGSLDVNSQEIISAGGTDIVLHSDNDLNVVLGDAAGVDDFNIKDSADSTVFSVNSDGAVTAVSYGGIAEPNLVDKSADETVTGTWTFTNLNVTGSTSDFTAGGTISSGDVVYMAANGKVLPADADGTAIQAQVLGIAQAGAVLDGTVSVLLNGTSTAHSALTVGTAYYLSTTAGGVTASPSSASGVTLVKIGVATATTDILFHPEVIGVRS